MRDWGSGDGIESRRQTQCDKVAGMCRFLAAMFASAWAGVVSAAILHVSPRGSDDGDGSQSKPFRDITADAG
jgi:hypothetical protein